MTITRINETTFALPDGTQLSQLTKDEKSFILPKNDENVQFVAVSKLNKLEVGASLEVKKIDHSWIGHSNSSSSNKPAQKSVNILDLLDELSKYLSGKEHEQFAKLYMKAVEAKKKADEAAKAKDEYTKALELLKSLGIDPTSISK